MPVLAWVLVPVLARELVPVLVPVLVPAWHRLPRVMPEVIRQDR